jgi:nitrite reductase/ring-hydroxylating ferredoxin subunit
MNDWIRICTIEDIPRLGARVVRRAGEDAIAVFRAADDNLYAVTDRCPHRGGPLSQGIVSDTASRARCTTCTSSSKPDARWRPTPAAWRATR